MAGRVGVLVAHGMGSQKEKYAAGFERLLRAQISELGADPEDVVLEPVHWADVLATRENRLLEDLRATGKLRWDEMRGFIVSALGDAIAYQRVPGSRESTYQRIHSDVHAHLSTLRRRLLEKDQPIIALGHSLGSVILSNHIWDEQAGKGRGRNALERMETLVGFVTFGSTLPLFTLAYDKPATIQFPPPKLPAHLHAAARWLNFFDPDDVLGWPLRPTSESYKRSVTADVPVNVGGLKHSWNPLSHGQYWTDQDFVRPVARLVVDVVKAQRQIEAAPSLPR